MIRKIYTFFYSISVLFIIIASISIFIFFNKDILSSIAQKQLKDLTSDYSSIEGTFLSDMEIRDFKYRDFITAKKLNIKYNFFMLIKPTPRVDSLDAEEVFIDLDKLLNYLNTQDAKSDFAFNISDVKLKKATLLYKNEKFYFDFSGSNLSYRDIVDIDKIDLALKSKYADIRLSGDIRANNLRAKSSVLISDETSAKYIDFLSYTPKELMIDANISAKTINLKTDIKNIEIKDISELVLEEIKVNFSYFIEKENFVIQTNYKAKYKEHEAALIQNTSIDKNAKVISNIKASIINKENTLPFDEFALMIDYENNVTKALFNAKDLSINLMTQNFKNFSLGAESVYGKFDAEILKEADDTFLKSHIYLKDDFLKYKGYDLKRFSKLSLNAHEKNKNIVLSMNSDIFSLVLSGNKEKIDGFANLGSANFKFNSDLEKKTANLNTKINSVDAFLKEVGIKPSNIFFDAKIEAKTDINFKDTLEIYSKINMPSYLLKPDLERTFSDTDNTFEFFYKNSELTLKKYNLGIFEHRIYSDRPSKIFLDSNSNIVLSEFWIYDNVLLRGLIDTSNLSAGFSIKSDNFHYKSKDADVTLMMDLRANFEADGKQHIDGELIVLDGTIMYESKKDYKITDKDIIIIQDIKKEENKLNRKLNIHITSQKPINYKVKDKSLTFIPNIILFQEMNSYLQILGVANIINGEVVINEKNFEFDKSELYFHGGKEIDPNLNLNLHYYTADNIDIEIFVTNRVSSPVIIFSSKPAMSQNDILSYILFGESASSIFDSSPSDSSKTSLNTILLGTGFKKMLNETTNVKIDTLNILTNKEGTLGYEIGARFNKNIRIVYKNDEIYSLILQYSLNKSLRIDVDIKETGQGVSIVYMKDFNF